MAVQETIEYKGLNFEFWETSVRVQGLAEVIYFKGRIFPYERERIAKDLYSLIEAGEKKAKKEIRKLLGIK